MSYNKVIMMGRLTRDPELRTIGSGTNVAEFGLAVDSGWGDNKRTTFIDVTSWGKQSEFVTKYFKKGDGIHIEGRLEFEQWEDKNGGGKRSKHKVTAERVTFTVGGKSDQKPNNNEPIPMDQKKWDDQNELDQVPF